MYSTRSICIYYVTHYDYDYVYDRGYITLYIRAYFVNADILYLCRYTICSRAKSKLSTNYESHLPSYV